MLRLEGVYKDWKDFRLENVSFEVKRGEYFVILGHSGAGKTLLLELIAGIHKPDRGKIYLNGKDITELPPEEREIAYIPQNYALFPHMSVYDNVAYGLKVRKVGREEIDDTVRELAEILGISHLLNRKPKTLSGGEKQRVAIARALAIKPKVLLLDEPLSSVDPCMRSKLIREMRRWHRNIGFTAIHVTHDFDEAFALGDRICVMINGKIERIGGCKEVFESPRSVRVAEFMGYNVLTPEEALKIGLPNTFIAIRPEDIEIGGDLEGIVEDFELRRNGTLLIVNVGGVRLRVHARERVEVGSEVRVSIRRYERLKYY